MAMAAVNVTIRGISFLWTLLIMALAGNMVASNDGGSPSIISYSLFVSVFAMLSLFYLIPASLKDSFVIHPILMVGLDVLNVVFFFCGAVAFAAELGAHSCSNDSYTRDNKITNSGGSDRSGRCREAQATTAFLWFGFATFAASAVVGGLSSRGRK